LFTVFSAWSYGGDPLCGEGWQLRPVLAEPWRLVRQGVRVSYPEPRYLGDGGEPSAVVRRADAQPDLLMPHGSVGYLATGASTGGDFGLYRWDMAGPPTGPGAHFHRTLSESFFVLSGVIRILHGNDTLDAGPGDFVHVPPGGVHGFRNESGRPASMVILFTPGAPREGYFEGLAEIAATGRRPTTAEWQEFYLRHDNHWV
jgi:mannose-6-phosphate isomerase-like protein (cupin superfamily)